MKAAIYAWVSTRDQEPANQRADLRRSLAARRWCGVEYVDCGVTPNNMPSFIVNDQFTAKDSCGRRPSGTTGSLVWRGPCRT